MPGARPAGSHLPDRYFEVVDLLVGTENGDARASVGA